MPPSRSSKFKAFGPTILPAIIRPNKEGILVLFRIIGAKRIMTRINKNLTIGLVSGKLVPMLLIVSINVLV